MSEIIIRTIISLLVIIVAVSFFIKYRRLLPTEAVKTKETLIFFFALIAILVSILEPLIKKEKLPPDYLNLNKPYLETLLIVDKVTEKRLIFHFSIENLGKLPAENISYNIYSHGSYSYEQKPYYDRQLPPNGKMTYNPDFLVVLAEDVKPIIIELEIFYKASINNEDIYFRTLLNFKIPRNRLEPGVFEYDSKDEKKEPKPDIDLKFISTHSDSVLEGPQGTFVFDFDETKQSGTNIIAFYSSPSKEVLFDPNNKIIVFKVKLDDTIIVLRKTYYKPGISFHKVAVGWNIKKKEYFLYVDGN